MAQVARHAPRPSTAISRPAPAPPPPPTTLVARRPDTPRRGAQVTGEISGNLIHCQEASTYSSEKLRMPKSSGGTYSKPDARVKLIPSEEITYVQHRKPYRRFVGSAGLQKRHRRRSITPPPTSRKVSIVPMPKRLETAENRESLVGEHITKSEVSNQIASPTKPAPPSCKSSQPSKTYLNTDDFARGFDKMDIAEAFSSYYGSRIGHPRGGSSEWPDRFPKETAVYSLNQAITPQLSEDHTGTKVRPSSKNACSPESKDLLNPTSVFRQQSTVVYPDRIRTPAPILRKHILPRSISLQSHKLDAKAGAPSKTGCTPENGKSCSTSCNVATRSALAPILQSSTVESALLNPTPVLGERSRELCMDGTRTTAAPIQQSIVKHVLPSPMPLVTEGSTDVYPNRKAGLKEAVVNHLSPSPKPVLAPCSSEDNLGTKAGPPSNSVCTPEDELHTRSCNLATRTVAGHVLQSPVLVSAPLSSTTVLVEISTEVNPDRKVTAVPTQQDPFEQHVLPNPTSLLSERSTEVHPNSSTGLCSSSSYMNTKIDMVSQQHKSIPRSHSLPSTVHAQCSASSCDASSERCPKHVQETGAPAILHTKLHRKHYQSEAPWKGNFNVTGELKHTCDGLEAQFPFQIFVRVYEASKKMPELLKLEAVALSQVWPKKFKMKPPDGQDIGLCFISSRQGAHRSFDHLLEKISSHIGLWTNIGDTELSVFSSKLLSPDYQRKDGKFYFWGVFGKRLRKNQHYHSNLSLPNDGSGDKSADTVAKLHATEDREIENGQRENGMRVDERGGKSKGIGSTTDVTRDNFIVSDKNEGANVLNVTRGNETDRVNECAGLLGTLSSYHASSCAAPAASLRNGCCSHATANKSTFSIADSPCRPANITPSGSDLVVDYPPGVSPKTDRVNDRATMLGTPDSNHASLVAGCCRDTTNKSTFSVAGLVLDKPPGFSLKNDRVDECTVVLGTPDSNSASNGAATASLLDGCCSHGSANKSTSSLADFPYEPANIASAASELMLDKPNGCDVVLGTPSSEPASSCTAPVDSLLGRCFGRDWNKSTFSLSDSLLQPADTSSAGPDLKLDTHPGFSLNAPPGFSKAHCRTQANDTPYVDSPRSLVMDTTDGFPNNIPPGFTEAHRRLPRITSTEPEAGVSTPTTEKKPLIRFSLNVPRLVKTETLPGFTAPNAAKKESGSPAVDKATEKLTPSPLAFGAPSVRKAGKADGTRITRDEVITEDDEISEEREFPKIRRLSELYSTPRSCTEVCRSVALNLDDKFQVTEQPEEHRHHGKKVMQEPPAESSLSDTARRLKVNGRLALSNVIDRQPNRDQGNGSSTPSIVR